MPTVSGSEDQYFTYTEIKEKPIYSFGYGSSVQILKPLATYTGTRSIGGFIKGVFASHEDLGAYVKPTSSAIADLSAAIRRIDVEVQKDFYAFIRGFASTYYNLPSSIGGHLPVDLQAFGGGHLPVDLGAYLRSPLEKLELSAFLQAIYKSDLGAVLQALNTKQLGALLTVIAPVDLQAFIDVWHERYLPAEIDGVYGPYDIQAYLRVHPYMNLLALIRGWYSGIQNLIGVVEGYHTSNLAAYIGINPGVDLGAWLNARGKSVNLGAYIIPNVIRLKKAIQVALLEHSDLKALVNFQCFYSSFADLGVMFDTIFKKHDLQGFVFGWLSAEYLGNLKAYINSALYDVENNLDIRFVPDISPYTQLVIKFGAVNYPIAFDTLQLLYGNFNFATLGAYIYAMPRAVNLGASIIPLTQSNFSELPDYVRPKSHVVVLKFNERRQWMEDWRRFVEIMFNKEGAEPYHYFYVSGTNKIYKIDRDRHWTIWASSYDKDEETMFDRKNVRSKFIFDMRKYAKMDEAVRDLIDRVSAYREVNLQATLVGVDTDKKSDLNAEITGVGSSKRKWSKYLNATINGII